MMDWVVTIKETLEKAESLSPSEEEKLWKKQSIYKVPSNLSDLNKKAYTPQVVSFGPYHHGNVELEAMEQHKQRALLHFVKRSKRPVDEHWKALADMADSLMGAYDHLRGEWLDPDNFLQLMMLDACFMLEILLTAAEIFNDYAYNDPIFSSHGKLYNMPFIRRDMLMIENQIPLMALQKLLTFQCGNTKSTDEWLNELILKFCTHESKIPKVGEGLHVLDIYRKSMLVGPCNRTRSEHAAGSGGSGIIRSAMELHEAGIRFKKSKCQGLRDITFHGGILRLPVVVVDDTTESTFLNLMAFERLHVGAGNEVTSYVFFMDNIIDSAKDVSLLHSQGIIQNAIGSDKAVAKLFNTLSKDVTLEPDSTLDEVHHMVNDYCRKKWNEWRANLIHTYFRGPWAVLSLVAAIFLLALTVAQTFYSIYSYYKPNNGQ